MEVNIMNGDVKKQQQPLMFSVSDYKELNSIGSLIMIGKNIERLQFNEMVKEFDPEQDTDLDVMYEFISRFNDVVLHTNNVEAVSKEYMRKTTEFMDHYLDIMTEIVVAPEKFDNYIQRPVNDGDRFRRILEMCMNLYNAIRVLVYNESDVHTVSLMTIMHMIGMMNVQDENLNYTLLKIVGRFNESKASDVDDWLETLEYDYELFHQKNILDTLVDLISLSPRMVLDLNVYRLIVSPDFDRLCGQTNQNDGGTDIASRLDNVVDHLVESSVRHLATIENIMNTSKFDISEYFLDLFNEELGMLPYYNVKVETVEVETELGCEENTETVKFKTKQYTHFIDEIQLREHLEMILYDYLLIRHQIEM
jgi:hypothetical protein